MDTEVVILMGISGVGKTTIGIELSRHLNCEFFEGDDFHSLENKKKMSNGSPLSDSERYDWLQKLATIAANAKSLTIISCSALKKSYRQLLTDHDNTTIFVHLRAAKEIISQRLKNRREHFFNDCLLGDQILNLEPLTPTENGFEVEVDKSIDLVVAEILTSLNHF